MEKKEQEYQEYFQKNIKSCQFEKSHLAILYESGEIDGIQFQKYTKPQKKPFMEMRSYIGDKVIWGLQSKSFVSVCESNQIKYWSYDEKKAKDFHLENECPQTEYTEQNLINKQLPKKTLCQQQIRKQVTFINSNNIHNQNKQTLQKYGQILADIQNQKTNFLLVGNSKDTVSNISLYKIDNLYKKQTTKEQKMKLRKSKIVNGVTEKFTINQNSSIPIYQMFCVSTTQGIFVLNYHAHYNLKCELKPKKYNYYSALFVNWQNIYNEYKIDKLQIYQDSLDEQQLNQQEKLQKVQKIIDFETQNQKSQEYDSESQKENDNFNANLNSDIKNVSPTYIQNNNNNQNNLNIQNIQNILIFNSQDENQTKKQPKQQQLQITESQSDKDEEIFKKPMIKQKNNQQKQNQKNDLQLNYVNKEDLQNQKQINNNNNRDEIMFVDNQQNYSKNVNNIKNNKIGSKAQISHLKRKQLDKKQNLQNINRKFLIPLTKSIKKIELQKYQSISHKSFNNNFNRLNRNPKDNKTQGQFIDDVSECEIQIDVEDEIEEIIHSNENIIIDDENDNQKNQQNPEQQYQQQVSEIQQNSCSLVCREQSLSSRKNSITQTQQQITQKQQLLQLQQEQNKMKIQKKQTQQFQIQQQQQQPVVKLNVQKIKMFHTNNQINKKLNSNNTNIVGKKISSINNLQNLQQQHENKIQQENPIKNIMIQNKHKQMMEHIHEGKKSRDKILSIQNSENKNNKIQIIQQEKENVIDSQDKNLIFENNKKHEQNIQENLQQQNIQNNEDSINQQLSDSQKENHRINSQEMQQINKNNQNSNEQKQKISSNNQNQNQIDIETQDDKNNNNQSKIQENIAIQNNQEEEKEKSQSQNQKNEPYNIDNVILQMQKLIQTNSEKKPFNPLLEQENKKTCFSPVKKNLFADYGNFNDENQQQYNKSQNSQNSLQNQNNEEQLELNQNNNEISKITNYESQQQKLQNNQDSQKLYPHHFEILNQNNEKSQNKENNQNINEIIQEENNQQSLKSIQKNGSIIKEKQVKKQTSVPSILKEVQSQSDDQNSNQEKQQETNIQQEQKQQVEEQQKKSEKKQISNEKSNNQQGISFNNDIYQNFEHLLEKFDAIFSNVNTQNQQVEEEKLFQANISRISNNQSQIIQENNNKQQKINNQNEQQNNQKKQKIKFYSQQEEDQKQQSVDITKFQKSDIVTYNKNQQQGQSFQKSFLQNNLLSKRKRKNSQEEIIQNNNNIYQNTTKKVKSDENQLSEEKMKKFYEQEQMKEKIYDLKKLNIFYLTEKIYSGAYYLQFTKGDKQQIKKTNNFFSKQFTEIENSNTNSNNGTNTGTNNITNNDNSSTLQQQQEIRVTCFKNSNQQIPQEQEEIIYNYSFKNEIIYFKGNQDYHVFIDNQNQITIIDLKKAENVTQNPIFYGTILYFYINFNSDLIILTENYQLKIFNLNIQTICFDQNIKEIIELGIQEDQKQKQSESFLFDNNNQKQQYILKQISHLGGKKVAVFFNSLSIHVYNSIFGYWEVIPDKQVCKMLFQIVNGEKFNEEQFVQDFQPKQNSIFQIEEVLQLLIEKYEFLFIVSFTSHVVAKLVSQEKYQQLQNLLCQFLDQQQVLAKVVIHNNCQALSLVNALLTQKQFQGTAACYCLDILSQITREFEFDTKISQ